MIQGDTFPPGTELLEGRFVITGVIASGGQAITYEGLDKLKGERVAIKRFSVRGASSWKEVELAEREARVLSGLDHPSLPKLTTHFEEHGALYLVLEYVEGSTLDQLRSSHRLSQSDVTDYLKQVADILHYLHGQSPPIVHRDIKPRNLIRRPDGRIVLVDFGSVRDRLRPEGGSTVVGTFGYMAPEQFQGRANPASDTYGAAATALALLTGREPDQLPHQGLRLDVEKALGGNASPEVKQFLTACLDPNPDTRPASLRDALTRYPLERVSRPSVTSSPKYARANAPADLGERIRQRAEQRAGHYADPGQPPFQTPSYERDRSGGSRAEREGEAYAYVGQAPFATPGYQRDRTGPNRRERRHERREQRRQERREQRRQERTNRRQRRHGSADVDVERPLLDALRVPEVRRFLRIPIVGLIVFVLLMVLRTALWVVLSVLLPRILLLLQRVTGARLLDTVRQTTDVGGSLHEQLTRVASEVRENRQEPEVEAEPRRYRVAPPNASKFDQMADDVEKHAADIEAEIDAAIHGWDHRTRK